MVVRRWKGIVTGSLLLLAVRELKEQYEAPFSSVCVCVCNTHIRYTCERAFLFTVWKNFKKNGLL